MTLESCEPVVPVHASTNAGLFSDTEHDDILPVVHAIVAFSPWRMRAGEAVILPTPGGAARQPPDAQPYAHTCTVEPSQLLMRFEPEQEYDGVQAGAVTVIVREQEKFESLHPLIHIRYTPESVYVVETVGDTDVEPLHGTDPIVGEIVVLIGPDPPFSSVGGCAPDGAYVDQPKVVLCPDSIESCTELMEH